MEMYADVDARGGILEPPGIVEVKYRAHQQVEAMHRIDEKLMKLDAHFEAANGEEKQSIQKEIKAGNGGVGQDFAVDVFCQDVLFGWF
eukprot:s771_g10.t1